MPIFYCTARMWELGLLADVHPHAQGVTGGPGCHDRSACVFPDLARPGRNTLVWSALLLVIHPTHTDRELQTRCYVSSGFPLHARTLPNTVTISFHDSGMLTAMKYLA